MAEAPVAAAPVAAAPAGAPASFLGDAPPVETPAGAPAANANPYAKEDWRHTLPEEIRSEASLKLMHDVPTLAKSYLHAQRAVGAEKVALPSKHASPDDIQKFYDAIGRPALDKYDVAAPKESKFIEQAMVDRLKPIAHQSGILPAQLSKVLEFYEAEQTAASKENAAKTTAKIETGISELKTEWGKAFDQKAAWAKRYVADQAPELVKFFQENKELSFDPTLIRHFSKLGEAMYKEDSVKAGQSGSTLLTPSEAMDKYNGIMGDTKHPYHLPDHPGHKGAVKEVEDIFKMAYPSEGDQAG